VKAHININLVEKIPLEFKISHFPLSFHFYDAVPIMMAKYLSTFDINQEHEKEDLKELL